VVSAGRAVGFYFLSWIFPFRPMPIYPGWLASMPLVVQLLPLLAIGLVAGACWRWRATWGRHALLGLGFFAANLLPVIGLVSMAWLYVAPVGDHFVYVPQIGLIGLTLAVLATARAKIPAAGRVLPYVIAIVVALLAVRARSYAEVFRSPRALWTYAVEQNPDAWVAHSNLGSELLDAGDNAGALRHLEIAVRLKPSHPQAQFNLALALERAGRPTEAVTHYERALAARSSYADAQSNLGALLARLGRTQEAIDQLQAALLTRPDFVQAHYNLANVLSRVGRAPEAIRHYERALALDPGFAEAHNNLGTLLYNQGDTPGARRHFEAAVKLKPDYTDARNNLAAITQASP
jgi:tetratricopeptide (TPR) repeat protein